VGKGALLATPVKGVRVGELASTQKTKGTPPLTPSITDIIDLYPNPLPDTIVTLRPKRVQHILHIDIDNHKIINYLKNLGLQLLDTTNDALRFRIPPTRNDLTREIDLIEEIARLHGFHNVKTSPDPVQIMNNFHHQAGRKVKNILVNSGFYEAVNLTFTDPELLDKLLLPEDDDRRNLVKIINPLGPSFSVLRSTLIPQLLKNLLLNFNHSHTDVKLFEMNKVFTRKDERLATEIRRITGIMTGKFNPLYWKEKSNIIDFYDPKGTVQQIFDYLAIENITLVPANEPYFLPASGFYLRQFANNTPDSNYICYGSLGKLDPKVLSNFDITSEVFLFDLNYDTLLQHANFTTKKYVEPPKFPIVYRDLSFVVSEQFLLKDIFETVISVDPNTLKNVVIFDQFKGQKIQEGFRSISINISLSSTKKTLTEEQIKIIMERVVNALKKRFNIEMR